MNELITSIKELADGVMQFVKPSDPMIEFFRKKTQRYVQKLDSDGKPVIGEDGKPVLIPDGKPFKEVRLYSSKIKVYDTKAKKSMTLEGYIPFNKRLALLLVKLGIGAWTTSSGLTDAEDADIFDEVDETAWVVDEEPAPESGNSDSSDTATVTE